MRLKELLHDIVDVNFDIEIKGVTCNPKRVKRGYLLVCLSEAGKRCVNNIKASAIIASFTGHDAEIHAFHPNPQKVYSKIVSRFYQFKQPKYVAAVTGTNGKTSVVEFCRQIWRNSGYDAASIGTLGTCINNERKDNNRLTTPDADDLYATLRDINNKNIEHLALEASSHGIDQYRIHGLGLNAAAFTNFSHDHLDYHKNVNEYFEAKKRLFYEVLPTGETVILNVDVDEYYALLKVAEKRGNKVITYGRKGSDITLLKQTPKPNGQHLTIKISDEIYCMFFPVLGQFQAYNLLCAIGVIISSGVDYREICIDKLVSPPGRMEKVKPFTVVDYAHTPSALKQALLSLKWHLNKKIILVFGCGGDRDQTKRAGMGKIAQMYADRVVVTDDNPRDEDPAEIRRDILLHCPDALEIGNRKEAIEKCMNMAYNEGMILLVAGKGHERYQIMSGQTFEFSDVEVIRNKVMP
ncbi:Mur ligase family protein [Wolbachia pipientis]|uniref:Mur ligase family protein n=1 Tax=Wolbachia pipientis TaxID=955 RepID=UPI0025A41B8A|nr:UDP-N-acetylmuramoyl-L-alanyl-D-glutamate--2,6-diaminopimelate ligase [Wolbachia pipientis]MDM8335112.1 UDP-N-acetylmuramoyl-L-alanyl-D-glutamate--2,6-diaminopimelate ligase [Wolbachia pipientis]